MLIIAHQRNVRANVRTRTYASYPAPSRLSPATRYPERLAAVPHCHTLLWIAPLVVYNVPLQRGFGHDGNVAGLDAAMVC
jgi:hypothetical protein